MLHLIPETIHHRQAAVQGQAFNGVVKAVARQYGHDSPQSA
jgi:hypothetical protein